MGERQGRRRSDGRGAALIIGRLVPLADKSSSIESVDRTRAMGRDVDAFGAVGVRCVSRHDHAVRNGDAAAAGRTAKQKTPAWTAAR